MMILSKGQKVIRFDCYEEGAIIIALNDLRNKQIQENKSTDTVDEILLKIIDAPSRKVKYGVPEKSGDFLGKGGAAERTSFCRQSGETSERSLRRRDEAR